jgi:hypothetical protein
MQTKETNRVAHKMAAYVKNHSLRQTAIKFNITCPDGSPSTGMVKLIILGYEPKKKVTRIRLGFAPVIKLPPPKRTINEHLQNDFIQDMPGPLLAYAIANREMF